MFLVKYMELWEVIMMESNIKKFLASLRVQIWERNWEHKLDLHWEATLMECHVERLK